MTLVTEARRVLGDTDGLRWSDDRLLDILNRGIRDIARHGNMYRGEYLIELQKGRLRYPLPTDVLKVTSVYLDDEELPILSYTDRPTTTYVSKDQINIGILEIVTPTITNREPLMFSGEVSASNDIAMGSNSKGVASNPVHSLFGVTSGLTIPLDKTNASPFGIITGVASGMEEYAIHYKGTGTQYGVITSISMPTQAAQTEFKGTTQFINDTRVVGRYGFPTVIPRDRAIRVMYKSLPPKVISLEQSLPLGNQWEDLIVDWLVGTALSDDNDAGNQQRSQVFIQRYLRNLEKAISDSASNYTYHNSDEAYLGGIVKKRRRRR